MGLHLMILKRLSATALSPHFPFLLILCLITEQYSGFLTCILHPSVGMEAGLGRRFVLNSYFKSHSYNPYCLVQFMDQPMIFLSNRSMNGQLEPLGRILT